MINLSDNYKNVEAKVFGDYESLKLGGHKLIIKKAYAYTGQTGNTSLKVEVDILGGEQANFFKKQYESDTRVDKKWPSAACKYVSLNPKYEDMLKGFITSVENSNANTKVTVNVDGKDCLDETKLPGLIIGGTFGIEEFLGQDGSTKSSTKLTNFRSVNKIENASIPKVKTLNNGYVDYEEYMATKVSSSSNNNTEAFESLSDDDDPFAGIL